MADFFSWFTALRIILHFWFQVSRTEAFAMVSRAVSKIFSNKSRKSNQSQMSAKFMSHQPPSTEVRPSLEEIKSTLQRIMPEIKESYKVKYLGVLARMFAERPIRPVIWTYWWSLSRLPLFMSSYAWNAILASKWASR